jgi:hypothetical protein
VTREDLIYANVYAAEFDRQRIAGATADEAHTKARAEARVAVEGAPKEDVAQDPNAAQRSLALRTARVIYATRIY